MVDGRARYQHPITGEYLSPGAGKPPKELVLLDRESATYGRKPNDGNAPADQGRAAVPAAELKANARPTLDHHRKVMAAQRKAQPSSDQGNAKPSVKEWLSETMADVQTRRERAEFLVDVVCSGAELLSEEVSVQDDHGDLMEKFADFLKTQ